MTAYKIPVSVLVVIHTPDLQVLLLERANAPGFWQSVTGSLDAEDEPQRHTAVREVREETAIDATAPGHVLRDWGYTNRYEIYKRWISRYGPGVTHNTEHVFGLTIPAPLAPVLTEHLAYIWLPWRDAAEQCFSWSNAEAIRKLPEMLALPG
ncbi:MAG: dihydroneopterin triphosphate diphosphatase [Betaproteobacteria bacterium]|nr:dihydroneopterin triphosphate diphosphatase [Betaproteobacteria bacterium]